MIFPRQVATPGVPPEGAERLSITIPGVGEVEAYLSLPARAGAGADADGDAPGPFPLVVIFHGNAESVDDLDWFRLPYLERGWAVLTPEYRGYGRAAGTPSQAGIVEDAVAFVDMALARPEIDRTRVVYHGRSLGGGVAAQVALRRKPRGLILQSTFTSIVSMARGYYVPPFIVRHPFRNDAALRGLDVPVLLLHGTDDPLIPIEHSRKLAEIEPRELRTLVELAGDHNHFPYDAGAYWEAVDGWLAGLE